MKKIIQIIIQMTCVLFLIIAPMHDSNTTEMKMTVFEMKMLSEVIQKKIIVDKIENEYYLFFKNLDNVKSPNYTHDFINKLVCEAIDSKSLPSIVIAQAALETGYGKYNKLKNNLFGIKGRGIKSKTKEFYKGRFVTVRAEFQYFRTVKDAFNRHHQILNRYGVYGYDYKTWIDRIVACGYATDPNYDKKLNYIIEKYQLHRLDNIQKLNSQYKKISIEKCNPTPIFTYNTI